MLVSGYSLSLPLFFPGGMDPPCPFSFRDRERFYTGGNKRDGPIAGGGNAGFFSPNSDSNIWQT